MGIEPGEARDQRPGRGGRELETPPSTRYGSRSLAEPSDGPASLAGPLAGPLAKAVVIALVGAAALVAVGGIFASTAGLLFASGITGAGVGLVLARARVPTDAGPARLSRRGVTWLAIAIALAAVVVADVGTWLWAMREGGSLGLVDYLLTAFGPFVPGEAIIAALGAAWGATAGPVQG